MTSPLAYVAALVYLWLLTWYRAHVVGWENWTGGTSETYRDDYSVNGKYRG